MSHKNWTLLLGITSCFLVVAGCGSPDDIEPGRGFRSAKGDANGSCVGHCGGKSTDCWCDELCEGFGDCCDDKKTVCDEEPEPEESCLTDSDCAGGSYCFVEGGCEATEDAPGTCKEKPQACYEIYAPVCGCDDKTYDNDCFAASAGVNIAKVGQCDPEGQFCGGIAGIPCPSGYACKLDGDFPDAGGKCIRECIGLGEADCNDRDDCQWNTSPGFPGDISMCEKKQTEPPSCVATGCSGQLCAPMEMFSTCEWLPHYACYHQSESECGNFGANQTCDWKKTPKFVACMVSHAVMEPDAGACLEIDQMYLDAVQQAKQCSPLVTAPQCELSVQSKLWCGGCPTYVNDTSALEPIEQLWKDAGCEQILPVCPMVLCAAANSGLCETDGVCKDIE